MCPGKDLVPLTNVHMGQCLSRGVCLLQAHGALSDSVSGWRCFTVADVLHRPYLLLFFGGSSFNDETTQTARDPLEGGPACTNHNCHLARLGVTIVFVKPPQAAYSVYARL
jgi:hypothetical protein